MTSPSNTEDVGTLVARLREATTNGYQMDTAIEVATAKPFWNWFELNDRHRYEFRASPDEDEVQVWIVRDDGNARLDKTYKAPPYTASIDAALTLVSDEHYIKMLAQMPGGWVVEIADKTDDRLEWDGEAPTPALALVIAALEARRQAPCPTR